jgi:hypothetical protein
MRSLVGRTARASVIGCSFLKRATGQRPERCSGRDGGAGKWRDSSTGGMDYHS